MKIAIASEMGKVTEHFGYCEYFTLFEVKNKQIVKRSTVENPGHKPGFLPTFLYDLGVNVIISGGMGGGAVEIFKEKGVEVIIGATGEVEAAAVQYLQGGLKSSGVACQSHDQHGAGKQ